MTYHPAIDTALVLAMLLNLSMLASSRLTTCIRLFAFQSFLLALLPIAGEFALGEIPSVHAYLIAAVAMGLKVLLIPYVLMRILRSGEIHKDVEPFIGFTASVMIGALAIVASFSMASRLVLPMRPFSDLLLPTALSTIFIGLLTLVTRVKAITQVVGYLVLENGIFIFGLFLLKQTPLLVELGILLDVFVGVFIMAIVVYQIRREFDHIDTDLLDELKEV